MALIDGQQHVDARALAMWSSKGNAEQRERKAAFVVQLAKLADAKTSRESSHDDEALRLARGVQRDGAEARRLVEPDPVDDEGELNALYDLLDDLRAGIDTLRVQLAKRDALMRSHEFAVAYRSEFACLGEPGARVRPNALTFGRLRDVADAGFARFDGTSYELTAGGRELWNWLEPLM